MWAKKVVLRRTRAQEISASEVRVESNVAERVSRVDIPDKTVNRVNTEPRPNLGEINGVAVDKCQVE